MSQDPDFQLDDFLPYLLNRAAEATSLEFQQYYKQRYGMLRTEWRVLFHLGRYGPLTAKAICTRANIHKTKVSRAVSALAQRRFITRQTVPDDRRHEVLTLTKAGELAFEDLLQAAEAYNAELAATFSDDEKTLLQMALRKLSARARP